MAKKRTAKANNMKKPQILCYEIGMRTPHGIEKIDIFGTSYNHNDSGLNIYDNTNELFLVATFKDWAYCRAKDNSTVFQLPKDWGKVDGKDF